MCHVKEGTPLKDLLLREGILLDFPCGGQGQCVQCRVIIEPPTESGLHEKLTQDREEGVRLACKVILEHSCTVTIPQGRQTGGLWERSADLGQTDIPFGEAIVARRCFQVPEPSLDDQRSDWLRVREALEAGGCRTDFPDYTTLEDLARNLRENRGSVHILTDNDSYICSYKSERERFYGFAIDLGTTTIDISLHNLESGAIIARKTLFNKQASFGADVISRTQSFAAHRLDVRKAALDTIQESASMILAETGIGPQNIVRSVVVGNSVMIHILHDLSPMQLTQAPYINIISDAIRRRPVDFGWAFQKYGIIETLPLISAFVGADTTAVITALGLDRGSDTTLSIDIGTNGEVVLAKAGNLFTTSAAAGPAFEGAQIACGMRALPGAICDIEISDTGINYRVLGNAQPRGICGTALIEVVAGLLDVGLLDETGRLLGPAEATGGTEQLRNRLFTLNDTERTAALAITEDRAVYVSQRDLRELQLAKGALRTAIDSLLDEVGVEPSELDRVMLAGNFGTGLNVTASIRIGLIPQVDPERIDVVGNAALRGAALALVSKSRRATATAIPEKCSFLELSGRPDFQLRFTEAMLFKGPEEESAR